MTSSMWPLLSRTAAVGLLFAVIAGIAATVVIPVLRHVSDLGDTIEQQRELLGRLQYMAARKPELAVLEQRLQSAESSTQLLQGRTDAIKVASLQAMLTALVARSGGQFRSARALAPKEQEGLRLVGVQIQLTCFTEQMQELLVAIERAATPLFIEQLSATVIPPRGEGARHGRLDLVLDVVSPVLNQQ